MTGEEKRREGKRGEGNATDPRMPVRSGGSTEDACMKKRPPK
jgi:hypothetical protein